MLRSVKKLLSQAPLARGSCALPSVLFGVRDKNNFDYKWIFHADVDFQHFIDRYCHNRLVYMANNRNCQNSLVYMAHDRYKERKLVTV